VSHHCELEDFSFMGPNAALGGNVKVGEGAFISIGASALHLIVRGMEIGEGDVVITAPYFTPIHLQPFYRKMFGYQEGDFPITEDVAVRNIALPFFNNLKEEQIDYVVEKLKEGIKNSI